MAKAATKESAKSRVKREARKAVKDIGLEPIKHLDRDVREAASNLQPSQIRFLIDLYYQIQDYRKGAEAQINQLTKSSEPISLLGWAYLSMGTIEDEIKVWLDRYTDNEPTGMGKWAKSIVGIGPVLSAALLAIIDIRLCPTVGHIWSFGGQDPKLRWLGKDKARQIVSDVVGEGRLTVGHLPGIATAAGRKLDTLMQKFAGDKLNRKDLIAYLSKRPWNARLKTTCWKIAKSFVYVSNHPKDIYGKHYAKQKAIYKQKNDAGGFADRAKRILEEKRFDKSTDTYAALISGKLSDGHIDAMAMRWTVKLFLSHWHDHAYRSHFGNPPPNPYPMAHLGHVDFIPPPKKT